MAVYTQVGADELARLLERFDVGEPVALKGIAEGIENSNFLLDTTRSRYILTLYEKRVSEIDLPFFLDLIQHLAGRGLPVPRALANRKGERIQRVAGRPACLIEFLPGLAVTESTPEKARAAGEALGRMHAASVGFDRTRPNSLGMEAWRPLLERCGTAADEVAPGLYARLDEALAQIEREWPHQLPRAVIHADLFPDNVLMLGDRVTGLIDFYFACTDVRAYDLAVMHSAWAFDLAGERYDAGVGRALVEGYRSAFHLSNEERRALSVLARGACVRFALTRTWDWLNTPADALVTRKDPLAYVRRLESYEREDLFA
ncbi:homoserine kinase [Sphingomonas lenta]|uniref:Homoserine kinase n=1 Tax=Sphingomonas lenta TaxID=1141887 RepID=A0A2A2SJS9_9SPHN|nr:homoserine kinase [Sphingomonas lenta]PAX09468.1 homoserine kinase [Sphingomonas lenta]